MKFLDLKLVGLVRKVSFTACFLFGLLQNIEAQDSLDLKLHAFSFTPPEGFALPDPDHQKNGEFTYIFTAYLFPENSTINAEGSSVSNPVSDLISRYFNIAKSGDLDKVMALYNREALEEILPQISDPEVGARMLKGISALQGYVPKFILKVDDDRLAVFGYPIKADKQSKNLLPFMVRKVGNIYTLDAGGLPKTLPFQNFSNYILSQGLQGMAIRSL